MSLQIAVTIGRANFITPWHEVETFLTILVQCADLMCLGLLVGDAKHRVKI
jgi:hypothetical protein